MVIADIFKNMSVDPMICVCMCVCKQDLALDNLQEFLCQKNNQPKKKKKKKKKFHSLFVPILTGLSKLLGSY